MAWFRTSTLEKGDNGNIELVTFTDGTDEQIIAMINAYYNGDLTLEQIKEVWSVGDKRKIHINAMTATGVSEAHHADDYDYVIIDFDHDLLINPINGKIRALITLQQDRIFYINTTDMSYNSNTNTSAYEFGYMNSSRDNTMGWNACTRRTWCNNIYKSALPQYIQNNLKEVYKSTVHSGNTQTLSPIWIANTDYCFLLSEWEIFGAKTHSEEDGINTIHYINNTSGASITMPKGGNKYPYFAIATDRYKMPAYKPYGNAAMWWERSPDREGTGTFCRVNEDGTAGGAVYADSVHGIAPAFCL